jgi:hypothetical protein
MGIFEIFTRWITGRSYYDQAIEREREHRQAIADAFIARMEASAIAERERNN